MGRSAQKLDAGGIKKQLEKISKLQNNIGDHDIILLKEFKPFRNRADILL